MYRSIAKNQYDKKRGGEENKKLDGFRSRSATFPPPLGGRRPDEKTKHLMRINNDDILQ